MLPPTRPADPIARIMREVAQLQRQVTEQRSSKGKLERATIGAGGLNIRESGIVLLHDDQDRPTLGLGRGWVDMLDPDTRNRMLLANGSIYMWDRFNPDDGVIPGRLRADYNENGRFLRLYPPHTRGEEYANAFVVRGRTATETGWAYVQSDDGISINAQGRVYVQGGSGVLLNVNNDFQLYGLGETGASANLSLVVGGDGVPRVRYVNSSRRYKQDIQTPTINIDDVIALQPRTWRQKSDVAADPNTTTRYLGFIAEEVAALASLDKLLVNRDAQGRPNALEYDRFPAVQQVVILDHHKRVGALEAAGSDQSKRLAALEKSDAEKTKTIAAQDARIKKLEDDAAARDKRLMSLESDVAGLKASVAALKPKGL